MSSGAIFPQTRVADLAQQARAAGLTSKVWVVVICLIIYGLPVGSLPLYPWIRTNSGNDGTRQDNGSS